MINDSIPWTVEVLSNSGNWTSLDTLPLLTEKLELSSSVHSLFAFGEWVFMGGTTFMESKTLVIGTALRFTFEDASTNAVMYMNILSVDNGPGTSARYAGEVYTLTLVSPWYFSQFIDSGAYYGTVGTTVQNLLGIDLPGAFNSINVITTFDNEQSVYYRTKMTQAKFLNVIRKYAIGKNNKTTFFFTTTSNDFYVTDFSPPDTADYTAIDINHPDLPIFQQAIDSDITKFIFPTSALIRFNKPHGQSDDLWLNAQAALVYVQPMQGAVKGPQDTPVLPIMTGNQSNPFSYLKKDDGRITKIFSDDSLRDYRQIFNETINFYSRELMDSHQLELFCLPNVHVEPGKFCTFHITDEETGKDSIFSQSYMIESVSHVFTKLKGHTQVTLSAPGLSYDSIDDVVGLFHPTTK